MHLDGRLDDRLAVLALLDDHAEALEAEQRLVRRQLIAQQQLERGVADLIVVATVLAVLDALEHGGDAPVVALERKPQFLRLAQHGAFAGQLADEDALLVADDHRVDVLEGLWGPLHRGHVQAALVREGAAPHVGRVRPDRDVDDVGDEVGRLAQALELRCAQHGAPIFSASAGMIETRLALPQRSPIPLIVPWA